MKSVPLTAYARSATGRNAVRKLRAAGRIPSILYGRNRAAQSLELSERELDRLISDSASENVLLDLEIAGDAPVKRLALIQEVQHDPLTGRVLHMDFHEVAPDEKVTITVPVETVGTAAGVKNGGVLEHVLFKVKVRGTPADLPLLLEVDVSHLEMNQVLHLGEINVPSGVELLGDKNVPVITVAAPRTETEEAAAEGTPAPGTGEVEMIKEKKGEEGAPAEGKGEKKAEKK
jgi:large subunit ribosomal protein L25